MTNKLLEVRASKIMDQHADLFNFLIKTIPFSRENIIEGFIKYNSEVESLDNDAYGDMGVRVAMFIEYLLSGSWHQERQDILLNFLQYCNPKKIIDMGFGAPTKYCLEWILTDAYKGQLTLADKYQSAFDLSKKVLDYFNPNYANKINFQTIDLDILEPISHYDVFILQDAIEHSRIPEQYLKHLVTNAPSKAYVILSLPIAPPIPCHHIYWTKKEDAIQWVENCNLKILQTAKVYTNPAVDTFAENLGEIYNLMLLTQIA